MKAAIYCRFSTDKQTESSIADQVRVCTEYAEKHGHTVTRQFEDQGISGAAIGNRPGFLALMQAAQNREMDVIIVMDLSRLSRSNADLAKTIDRLNFARITVLAPHDNYDSSRDGAELISGLSGIIGQQFRTMVSKKTFAAHESRARTGRATGGRTFGYTSKNEIVPVEAAIVREIFERYARGESQRGIAAELNRAGLRSLRGGLWETASIRTILNNEKYSGRFVWNKTKKRKDPDSGRKVSFAQPAESWVIADRQDLRIVPADVWDRVRLKDAPQDNRQARPKYPLSGLLVCGDCGRTLTLSGGVNKRGFGSQRYVCPSYKEHGVTVCGNSLGVSRAVVEDLIIGPMLKRMQADPEFLASMATFDNMKSDLETGKNSYATGRLFAGTDSGTAPSAGGENPPIRLQLAIESVGAAVAAGAFTRAEGEVRIAKLRAEHERHTLAPSHDDTAAALERLAQALESGVTEAIRAALRRALGTVRCVPNDKDGERWLEAHFDGASVPLLDWLMSPESGRSAMVPRAGIAK